MEKDIIIEVKGLNKFFGQHPVVNDLALRIRRGDIYGFLGPNGSGKTTTIRMLCGLLTPDSGEGHCLGYNILTQSSEIKRHVGYMTQKFTLYEDLTIWENLNFIARIYALSKRRQRVAASLEQFGLSTRANQLAGALSGGWKQRLALAACLLHEPPVLLLDEPTAGVDPKARRDFWDQIHQLSAQGITTLVSTHYMDEAERCHRLAYIAYGNLLADGTITEIIQQFGLITWTVKGHDLWSLQKQLNNRPGVEQVIRFGNVLHVNGADWPQLEASLLPFMADPNYQWARAESSLEDIFIRLMVKSPDTSR